MIEGGTITKPINEDITYDDMHSTQKYEEGLRQEEYQDIMKYGVAFYRKECMVKIASDGEVSEGSKKTEDMFT